jgi:hypothetical protein
MSDKKEPIYKKEVEGASISYAARFAIGQAVFYKADLGVKIYCYVRSVQFTRDKVFYSLYNRFTKQTIHHVHSSFVEPVEVNTFDPFPEEMPLDIN